jgi:hypothetical protein
VRGTGGTRQSRASTYCFPPSRPKDSAKTGHWAFLTGLEGEITARFCTSIIFIGLAPRPMGSYSGAA